MPLVDDAARGTYRGTIMTELATKGPAALQITQPMPPDQHPALVYLASLNSPNSKRTMRSALDDIAGLFLPGSDHVTFPWAALRLQHTGAIRAALMATGQAAATVNKKLSALRGVLRAAWELEYMDAETYRRAANIKVVKTATPDQAAGRALSPNELRAMFDACAADVDKDGSLRPIARRDAALIAMAYGAGLRRSELAGLQLADYDQKTQKLTVHGKGNKVRIVPIHSRGALAALNDWLAVRGRAPGPLFTRTTLQNDVTLEPISDVAIYRRLARRADQSGVEEFSPHDMRRTYAGDLLDAGVDLVTVQKLMGHSNVSTTAGYDRRSERAKEEASEKLHVPWNRQG